MASPDSLARLTRGDEMQFFLELQAIGFTPEEIRKLNKNREVLGAMREAMLVHPLFRLLHARFHTLEDKMEMVREWPDVLQLVGGARAFDLAFVQAQVRIERFKSESPGNPFLNIVVSPYGPTAHETFAYGRARMMETFAGNYEECKEAYAQGVDEKRVRYLEGTPRFANCLRIEVINLATHFNPKDGVVPKVVRGPTSAHMSVIYGAAQDPSWVWQMEGCMVPYVLAGGLELNVPGDGEWAYVPGVWRLGGRVKPHSSPLKNNYHSLALPSVLE